MAWNPGSATPVQIDTLINFMDEHRDLALMKVKGGKANRLWKEVCNNLNSMGGCIKTVKEWQEVWFDTKQIAMDAMVDFRRSSSKTEDGPSIGPPLFHWQLVKTIMGPGFGEPQIDCREPIFFETNDEPMATTTSFSADLQEKVVEGVKPGREDRQLVEPASQPTVSQGALMSYSSLSSQPKRRRRRPLTAVSAFKRRLFQIEDERGEREIIRNTELAGIRAALTQMCDLLREFVDRRH